MVATAKGQDGVDLTALKGVTIPVRLAGPLEAPDWKVEWSGVAAAAVTQQLQKQIGEQLGLKGPAGAASGVSPQEALRNKLKGLFK